MSSPWAAKLTGIVCSLMGQLARLWQGCDMLLELRKVGSWWRNEVSNLGS